MNMILKKNYFSKYLSCSRKRSRIY